MQSSLYQPIYGETTHKNLKEFEKRIEIIKQHIPDGSSVIDIGCNYGWNCFKLSENKTLKITGVDEFPEKTKMSGNELYYFLANKTIKKYGITNVKILMGGPPVYQKHDYGIATYILHHYLKDPQKLSKGLNEDGQKLNKAIQQSANKLILQIRHKDHDQHIPFYESIGYTNLKQIDSWTCERGSGCCNGILKSPLIIGEPSEK